MAQSNWIVAKIFVDTLFVIALINPRDQHHARASQLAEEYESKPFLTTDAVLLEIGNALARGFKPQATEVIRDFLESEDVEIVRLTPELFDEGFALFQAYEDKDWGLVDCISFVVMQRARSTEALTFDTHFSQAGYRALMAEPSS